MKKILLATLAMLVIGVQSFAATTNWDSTAAQKRINNIGAVIISKNALPNGISFKVSSETEVNAYSTINKEVYVYKGLLQHVDTDEELAAVIAHEIGHIVNGHCAKQSILTTAVYTVSDTLMPNSSVAKDLGKDLAVSKLSRKDEFEADLTGVDLLQKAGYNPLAMISVLNKICGNYIDVLQTHPSGEKRLMNVYDYVDYNYNSILKKGYNTTSYKNALAVISPNVQKRNSTAKNKAKYEKQQKKLLAQKAKRYSKMAQKTTGWDTTYSALMLFTDSGSSSSSK